MDLVECGKDVVGKLDFGYGSHSLSGCSYGEAYQSLLAQWCIEDALCTEVCCEVHSASKHSSKLNVLTKHKDPLICLQGMAKRFIYRGVEVDALRLPFSDMLWKLRVGKS